MDPAAGAFAPPRHRHPSQVEEYEVPEGGFEVMVEGHWRTPEIASHLSLPEGTVKGRMRLGLEKLRNEMQAAS